MDTTTYTHQVDSRAKSHDDFLYIEIDFVFYFHLFVFSRGVLMEYHILFFFDFQKRKGTLYTGSIL